MRKIISTVLFLIFTLTILLLGLRGLPGNPTGQEINQNVWKDDGPLELSPDRGRYALTMSLIEDKSFHFSVDIARFATPDLGYKNGNYVSLFAPAVSFIIAPGYFIGRYFGSSQLGAFFTIILFAAGNALLVRSIAKKLGANQLAATISALIFIFASPAFAYSVSLYQHHITTFIILLSIRLLLGKINGLTLAIVWFLCALSIPVDYPNLFFMLPIGIFALTKLFDINILKYKTIVNLNVIKILSITAVIFPLIFFLWFNKESYGDPLQFSGTVASVKAIDENGKPTAPENVGQDNAEQFINPELQKKSSIGFFSTRDLPRLLYSHLLSPDRGVLYFTPIMFFGIIGMFMLYRKQGRIASLFLAIIGFNIFLYAMFGQGGWAFGSRYLIPAYAITAIFIAIALTYIRNIWLTLFFLLLMIYSVSVNTLGAVTTNRNPPKVEAVALEKISGRVEKYTFERNWDYLVSGKSKSYIYQSYAKNYLTSVEYYAGIVGAIVVVISGQVVILYLYNRKNK